MDFKIEYIVAPTEKEAKDLIQLINTSEGIPVNTEAVTRTYCTFIERDGEFLVYSDVKTKSRKKAEFPIVEKNIDWELKKEKEGIIEMIKNVVKKIKKKITKK